MKPLRVSFFDSWPETSEDLDSVTCQASLLCYQNPTPSDLRLAQLTQRLGPGCNILDGARDAELDRITDHSLCVLASAATIAQGMAHNPSYVDRLIQKARFLFVYGFCPRESENSVAARLSSGGISHVCRFDRNDLEYDVVSSSTAITREFAGLRFGPIQNDIDFGFVPSSRPHTLTPLVSIGTLPFWSSFDHGRCTTFLLACSEIIDINESTDRTPRASTYFSRLLPAAMFLKSVFERHCWNSRHRFANLIIDDPLLKETYGFLNYRDLLAKMDQSNFSTTIAFIPWNYKRTQAPIASLFCERSDRLSVCVHGCDHTGSEFAATDMERLNAKVRLASHRMRNHECSTGVAHSQTMVFPQGRFSSQALKALQCNNYLAAINSTAVLMNSDADHKLTIADWLDAAITGYEGFPLFLRRPPRKREDFAFDLFLGKPLLVVAHHTAFKDDGKAILEFIQKLNSLNTVIEWRGLNDILVRTYLERDISQQTTLCKTYTNHQIIENDRDSTRTYVITKPHNYDVSVQSVLINGKTAPFIIRDGLLQLAVTIPAKESVTVRIGYDGALPYGRTHEGGVVRASQVWMRRMLSELRDDIVCRNDRVLAAVVRRENGA